MNFSIVYKLSLSIFVVVIISSSVVGGLFYTKTTDLLVHHVLEDMAGNVHDAGNTLRHIAKTYEEDVLVLAHTPPIQGLLRAKTYGGVDQQDSTNYSQWVNRLESIFESNLRRKASYTMLRFINEDGQEIVNVVRDGGKIIRKKREQLQNKIQRPYVQETLKLPRDAVYLSEISLNREYGKVSEPRQEVIRITTPVYDEKTEKLSGMLVINAEIGLELRNIQSRIQSSGRNKIFITNDHGGYLLHPDESKTFGFDLAKRYRIQEDIPQLTKFFLPENTDQRVTLLPENNDGRAVVNFTKISFDSSNPNRYIAVIITQDYAEIVAEQSSVLDEISLWSIVLVFAGVGIAILFSFHITRPIKHMTQAVNDFSQQSPTTAILPVTARDEIGVLARAFESMTHQVLESQENLKELNDNLEGQVVERTRSLEESEAQLRTILNAIADAVVTIDSKGIIISFNPAAESIFGYKCDEILGQNVAVLMVHEEQLAHKKYIENTTLFSPRVINQARDLNGLHKNGTVFPIEINIAPLQGESKRGFVGVLRDITERNRAAQVLELAREEAENANKAKSQFLSNMSHELRTPMNAIIGFSQLLQIDSNNPISDTQKESVGEIAKAGKHLLNLINEILDLARIEAGHIDLSIETFGLSEVVAESLGLIVPLADKRGISINVIFNGTDVPLEKLPTLFVGVRADRVRLKQVLLNLLSNGVKYNSENGKLTLECIYGNDSQVRINVKDTGSGISTEQQARLFMAFDRLDVDQAEIEGTGIGLVITKNIVELMDGEIGVESHPGKGSNFWITLPGEATSPVDYSETDAIKAHKQLFQPRSNREFTVLYVEDNPANLRLVAQLLGRRPDIHLWSAHEPLLGLELAEEHKPDLILLDINLPGMDGYEVLRLLRQRESTKHTPVMAISANAMPKDIVKGNEAGFNEYITKPINVVALLEAIEKMLPGKA